MSTNTRTDVDTDTDTGMDTGEVARWERLADTDTGRGGPLGAAAGRHRHRHRHRHGDWQGDWRGGPLGALLADTDTDTGTETGTDTGTETGEVARWERLLADTDTDTGTKAETGMDADVETGMDAGEVARWERLLAGVEPLVPGTPDGRLSVANVVIGARPELAPTWWADHADELPVTGALLDRLDALPMDYLDDDQALAIVVAAERLTARAQALQARALARFAQWRPASLAEGGPCAYGQDLHRYAPDEVGCALGISRRAAGGKLDLAQQLGSRLPGTLSALHAGRIDVGKARVIAQATRLLDEPDAQTVEQQVLPRADSWTHARLRSATQRAATRIDPTLAAQKHRDGVADRRVELIPLGDGISDLWARLPAPLAAAAYDRICQLAERAKTPDDERTADQRRADVFADVLLGTATGGGLQAQIIVLTKETSLLRLDDECGELIGSGALPAEAVRWVAEQHPNSVWRRLLTDPATGAPKDLGRTRYRPTAALDEFVRLRAQVCYFPGCNRPAHRSDLDHLTPASQGGPTDADNLGPACRHHHPITDGPNPRWTVTQPEPGIYEVTSPTGRTYRTDPPPLFEPPSPHPTLDPDSDPPPF